MSEEEGYFTKSLNRDLERESLNRDDARDELSRKEEVENDNQDDE